MMTVRSCFLRADDATVFYYWTPSSFSFRLFRSFVVLHRLLFVPYSALFLSFVSYVSFLPVPSVKGSRPLTRESRKLHSRAKSRSPGGRKYMYSCSSLLRFSFFLLPRSFLFRWLPSHSFLLLSVHWRRPASESPLSPTSSVVVRFVAGAIIIINAFGSRCKAKNRNHKT